MHIKFILFFADLRHSFCQQTYKEGSWLLCFPCRAELFGWLATSLAEGLLAGATSEQVPQTNKTQKSLNRVAFVVNTSSLNNKKNSSQLS